MIIWPRLSFKRPFFPKNQAEKGCWFEKRYLSSQRNSKKRKHRKEDESKRRGNAQKDENFRKKNLVKELYRPGAIIGDGETADALRHEKETGIANHPGSHLKKVQDRVRQIEKILAKTPNHQDKDALIELLNDLLDALKGLENGR